MGIYNKIEMKSIKDRVSKVEQGQAQLVIELGRANKDISANTAKIMKNRADILRNTAELEIFQVHVARSSITTVLAAEATSEADRVADVLQALMLHRASPQLFTAEEMQAMLEQATKEAAAHGYELLPMEAAHVYQCETSFVSDEDGITIYVHMPMAQTDDNLYLYQHLPLPMPISDGSVITVYPSKNMIAIDAYDKVFRVLHSEDLGACKHMGPRYVCENANVVSRVSGVDPEDPNPDLCVYYLYTKAKSVIRDVCPVHIDFPRATALQVSGRDFYVVVTEEETGHTWCPGSDEPHKFDAVGTMKVTLEPGCSAETKAHRIVGSLDVDVEVKTYEYPWNNAPAMLLGDVTRKEADIIGSLLHRNYTNVPKNVKDVRDYLRGNDLKISYRDLVQTATNANISAEASKATAAEFKADEEKFKVQWEALIQTEKEEVQQSWTHRILSYIGWALLIMLLLATPFLFFKGRTYIRANKAKILAKIPTFLLNDAPELRELIRFARLDRNFRWHTDNASSDQPAPTAPPVSDGNPNNPNDTTVELH